MEYEVNVVFPYIYSFIIIAACFVIACVIGCKTLYRPDGRDIKKRRMWFWILWLISIVLAFATNAIIAYGFEYEDLTYEYFKHACIALACFAGGYILVGYIISLICKGKKLGTWF